MAEEKILIDKLKSGNTVFRVTCIETRYENDYTIYTEHKDSFKNEYWQIRQHFRVKHVEDKDVMIPVNLFKKLVEYVSISQTEKKAL